MMITLLIVADRLKRPSRDVPWDESMTRWIVREHLGGRYIRVEVLPFERSFKRLKEIVNANKILDPSSGQSS